MSKKKQIAKVMRRLIDESIRGAYHDDSAGLAEDAAHELGHDEWLDDEHHEVWEVANEIAEEEGLLT